MVDPQNAGQIYILFHFLCLANKFKISFQPNYIKNLSQMFFKVVFLRIKVTSASEAIFCGPRMQVEILEDF